jgi:gliding motility-associated-like protein
MNLTSTLMNSSRKIAAAIVVLIALTLVNLKSYAQSMIYANEVSFSSPNNSVLNPQNAISTSTTTFATVRSNSGLAAGIGAFQGELELKFSTPVLAGRTTYIRIDNANPDLLNTLLGGNLGNVLTNVVGSVALGNRYFEVGARMGTGAANNVLSGNSSNPFSTDRIRLVKDANGFFYVALTPNVSYDRVYLKDFTNAVVGLGASSYTNVYYAFHGSGNDPCAQAFATSFEGTGLTVDLLGLGKAGVTNPQYAIDADPSNSSEISLGALGVAGSISQDIYFENLSTIGDDLNIKIQAPSALLNAGLLNNIIVTAYNGATPVYTGNAGALLNLDLLGLLNAGQAVSIPFSPNAQFDRVKVTINSLLNAGLTQTFNLYSVTRSAGRPTFNSPLSDNVNTCSGTTTQLRASTLTTNQLLWYDVPTGGVPVITASNAPFTTPILTSDKTYYVSAKSIACSQESARVPITVTLNPIPALPVISTNNQTISSGQTATLLATADSGNTIQWFTTPTGGNAITTGPSFTTPPLTVTTIYYVGTESSLGCASASRVPVTVTVINDPINANCNAAIAQQTGINGICALCSIQGAGNSTDNNPANFTRINLAVGVGASGYQRLIFGNPGSATDSIRLDLETPTGLADLGALGGVTIRVMNGTNVVASYALNSTLLNLRLLSGNRFMVTVPATGVYDRVEVRLNAVVSALDNLNIYGAEIIFPNPTFSNPAPAICAGSIATLVASPNGGTTLKWFAESTGGTALATGNNFSTPVLTGTTTYYVEVSKGTCANAQRIPVIVAVNPAIVFAGSTLTNATLGSAYSKQLTPATGGTPAFTYTLATGSTLPAGLSLTNTGTIAGTPTVSGSTTFFVIATDTKGCSTTAEFILNVTPSLILPPLTLPNGTVGTTYPTQIVPAATGGTTPYTYTAINLPPGLVFNEVTREITGTPSQVGTFVVPVTATDGNGNTVSQDYTIIVRDPLLLPAATLANGTVGMPYPTQTIPSATGGTNTYVYSSPVPVAPGLTFNPSTREITGTPTQSGTFTVPITVVDGDNKVVTTNYTIVVGNPLVLAPKVLVDGTVNVVYPGETIPAATGGTGPYTYTSTTLPAGLAFNATTRQVTGTPTQSGNYNLTITVTDAANTTVSQTYALRVGGVLSLPTASLPNGTVGTAYVSQTLPEVSGGTAPYTYSVTGLPPGLTFNQNTRVLSGTPTTGGPYNITMTARDNAGLSTSTDYGIQINVSAPTVASITACSGTSAALPVTNTINGVTYRWYASTGNTPIFTGPTFNTPVLTATTTYYVEAVSGTAVSSRTAVTVTIDPAPDLATVITNNAVISAGQSTTLQATADAGNTIQWFAAATGGSALATGTSFTTPVLNATTTYYVQTSNAAGCISATRAPVTVTVSTGPANPNCNAAVAQQTAIDGICLLCSIQGAPNSTDANLTNFTRINLAVGVGASGYQRLIFAAPGSATDSIRLDLETPTGLADLSILNGLTVRVMNGATVVGTYPLNSALLNLQLLGGNRFTATVPAGGTFDRVEIRLTALVAALTNLNIYGAQVVYPNPTVATTGLAICSGSPSTLSAVANGGTILSWFASPTGGTAIATGEDFTTPSLNTTTTYYIEVSKAGCANTQRVPVTVIVTPIPATPAVAAVPPVCAGSAATINVNNPIAGVTYNWYSAATGGTILGSGTTFTTPILTTDATYFVEAVAGSCTSSSRTAVPVSVSPIPDPAVVTSTAETISAGQTATLTATVANGNTINWYASATGGTPIATGSPFITAPLTATTTYYAEAVNASGCTSASRVAVTVTVIGGTPNPNCNAANSQQSGINGICVLCSIQNPGNSVDDNLTNFTTLSLPVGVGGSAYQRLIFPTSGVGTDSIRLDLETHGGLADVTALAGIQVRIMNGGTVVATYNLSSSLLNLTLLSGNRFRATLPAVGNYDRVEVRAAGLVSALMNVRIYGAEVIYPNPTVSANGQTICAGSSAVLSASAKGGTTLRWYTAAVGGTLVATGENFTSPVLTATTTYYIEVSKGSCANVQRIPVTVTVTTPPPTPVVAVVAPVCSGSSAIISVDSPNAETTYSWFLTSTGGTSIFTGPVFTSAALSANTTFYVEAANGSCVNGARVAVNVTVNPLPALPQVQASSTTVNAGQTATLTATSLDPTVTFNWYDTLNSSTPIFSGQTFVTPPLTAATTYYAEAVSALGCASSGRVQVTVNVIPSVPTLVPCEAAINETNGVTGIALLANVFNPELAVDNDTQTSSSLVMPVGILGASVFQRLGFATLSNVGDTVRILLSSPSRLLSLGVLSNIQLTTYNNANSGTVLSINNSLVNLQLLSGGSQALVSFVPTQEFNSVEVRLNSGLAGALTSINVNYAQRAISSPEVASANVTVCETLPTTLTVQNPKAGITYRWYDAAGTYQAGKDGVSFITPAINANTTFSVEAVTASGCASSRTPINITVTPLPIQPTLLSSSVLTCANTDVVLTIGNPQPGYIYTWKLGNTVLQTGLSATYTVANITGPGTYTVTSANSCGIVSAETTATVDVGTPTPPVITPVATTINSGERVVLTATSTTSGATFIWYDRDPALPGAIVLSSPTNGANGTFLTDPLTTTTTFWVTSTSVACTSIAASVVVTVNPSPVTETVPCEAAINQENGVGGLVSILAGVDNESLVFDNNTNTGSSLRIPVGIGSFVYQRAIFDGASLIGDKIKLKLVSSGTSLSVALLQNIQVTTYNGVVSNNDTQVVNDPLLNLQLLSGNQEAIIEFMPTSIFDRVEVRLNSGLLGALTSVNFNYAQRIIVPPVVQSAAVSACVGSPALLAVQNPVAGVVYRWYLGTTYLAGQDGPSINTDASLTAGTYNYSVAAVRNGCESVRTTVTVTVLPTPASPVPTAINPTVSCPNVPVILTVDAIAGLTYNWYDAVGTLLAANTQSYTTARNLTAGTYDFFVEAINANSCASAAPRTKISIVVKPNSDATDLDIAGVPVSVCAGSTVTLVASSTTVTSPIFNWYSNATLTNLVFTGAEYKPVLTNSTTYYVTVSGDNKCENTPGTAKVLTLNVSPPATASDITVSGAENAYCAGVTATLTASTTTINSPIFNWYSDPSLKTLLFTGAEYKPVLTASTTFYVTVQGGNKCENLAADAEVVVVNVNPPATAADINIIGIGAPVCAGTTVSLTATTNTVINPVFTWYSDAALSNVLFTGPAYNATALTATTTLYVTVKGSNVCENTSATAKAVVIVVNPPAIAADIIVNGSDASLCEGSVARLVATSTTITNPIFTWYDDASLTNAVFIGATFDTPALSSTTTYYVTVKGANKCENIVGTAKVITLTVNPPATAADITVSGTENPFCNGFAARLVASSSTVVNPTFTWYSDASLTTVIFRGPVFNTPALTTTTTYFVTVSGANRCENVSGSAQMVTVTVNPPAVTADIIVSGADVPLCAGANVTLIASSTTVTNPVFIWYTDAALTNAVFTGSVLSIPSISASVTYYVTVRGDNRCENVAGTARVVSVVVNPLPDVPVVSSNGTNICSGDPTILNIQNPQSGVIYEWYDAAIGGTLVNTGAQFNTPSISANIDYYVMATSASGCGNPTGRVKVSVTITAKPDVPTVAASNVNTCNGNAVVLSVSNPVAGVIYRWYNSAVGGVLLGTGADFVTPSITQSATFYVEAANANCTSTSRTPVTVIPTAAPVAPASISGADGPQCLGTGTVLTVNNPDPAVTYRWYTLQSGGTLLFEGSPFNVPALAITTTFYVESVNKLTGCVSQSRTGVTVTVLPKLDAPIVVIQSATASSVTFQWAPVTGAAGYEVSIDNGFTWIAPTAGSTATTYTFLGLKPDQKVSIRVRAYGQLSCQLSDATTKDGNAENPQGNNVFIPNTFTPNGDGKNDLFYVYGNTVSKLKLRVYNQWGQFIYESLNIQNGWDGTYRGEMQPNGVYVYYVDIEFNDGTKAIRKGTITLLR